MNHVLLWHIWIWNIICIWKWPTLACRTLTTTTITNNNDTNNNATNNNATNNNDTNNNDANNNDTNDNNYNYNNEWQWQWTAMTWITMTIFNILILVNIMAYIDYITMVHKNHGNVTQRVIQIQSQTIMTITVLLWNHSYCSCCMPKRAILFTDSQMWCYYSCIYLACVSVNTTQNCDCRVVDECEHKRDWILCLALVFVVCIVLLVKRMYKLNFVRMCIDCGMDN